MRENSRIRITTSLTNIDLSIIGENQTLGPSYIHQRSNVITSINLRPGQNTLFYGEGDPNLQW